MKEFTIKNRYDLDNTFVKVEGDLFDGHFTTYKNTGNDYYFISGARYISLIQDGNKIVGIDPEGGLPINSLCIGDEVGGKIVKSIKVLDKPYPINEPISNIIITFE